MDQPLVRGTPVRGGTKGEVGKKTGREGDERGRLQEARGEGDGAWPRANQN